MAATSKSESLLYKDARSYCARRHMNTMWKSMRVDRRFDALRDKELHHLEKSRSYRARELDQEQELFLENLTNLFERQCEIAAGKLEIEIGDHMVKDQKNSADARLRGSRRKSLKRMKSFTVPIKNVLTDSELHVVPGCEHERAAPPEKSTLGENFRVSSAQYFRGDSRQNFVRGFDDYSDGRKSACCGHENEETGLRRRSRTRVNDVSGIFQTEEQSAEHAPSRLSIHESASLEPLHRTPSRKKSAASRPSTGRQSVTWGTVPSSNPAAGYNGSMTAKKPAWSSSDAQPYKPLSATRRARCKKCEPTIAWEIVPRNKRKHKTHPVTNKLQSTVFQPGQRDKPVDEETLFRKQFLACAMSRFLPISALRGASFGEHDDVRKKMEGRRRCLDELKHRHQVQIQSVPAQATPHDATMSRISKETTTRASSTNYSKSPMNEELSSKNETPAEGFFNL
ncbi:uncharacterized protein [Amphiura filiformis]|uniref:uncharacterized protein n=1 Tax=Amphiura filiformis TaxID=82378 RepID=UPI003B21F8BA